tara:strand:+ start:3260 stop:3802 length:543 start_codon:yes stop_codon:yes gene_type:complete
MGQNWIKTIAHTATIALLPILTYVITSVISGNIALSLGMVGALSIVRFRNPVRSPLELSVYFGSIAMGISAAVSIKWLLLLMGAVTLVSILLYFSNTFCKRFFGVPFFITSFSEGNSLSTLNVVSQSEIDTLNVHDFLTSKVRSEKGVTYTLASSDFTGLREIETSLSPNSNVISIQLNR